MGVSEVNIAPSGIEVTHKSGKIEIVPFEANKYRLLVKQALAMHIKEALMHKRLVNKLYTQLKRIKK